MIIIYIPCKDKAEAKKISKSLLEQKLIACANLLDAESMYRWEGKITEDTECIIFAKTKKENYEKVKDAVKELHSYDCPCIAAINIAEINPEYKKWLAGQFNE